MPWKPRGTTPRPIYTDEQEAEIARLYELALLGQLPRRRALKENEPERLNERHLGFISSRSVGMSQRLIAKAFGDNDAYVSMILNHPDSVYILARMSAMQANGSEYQERMEALAEPAMSAIEDALLEDDPEVVKIALRRAPLAFRVLEQGRKIEKPTARAEVEHTHRLEASPQQMAALRDALVESRELRDVKYEVLEISAAPGAPSGGADFVAGKEVRELSPSGDNVTVGDVTPSFSGEAGGEALGAEARLELGDEW